MEQIATFEVQAWLIGFFVICIGIGLFYARSVTDMKEYYIAGMKVHPALVSFSIAATVMSGWGYVGGPGSIFAHGMGVMPVIEVSVILGIILSYFLVAPPMRELAASHGAVTVPDLGEILFKDNRVRIMLAVGIIIGLLAYMSAQYLALTHILGMAFNIPPALALTIGVCLVTFYTAAAGRMGVLITDTLQGIIMVGAVGLVFFAVNNQMGGFGNVFSTLASHSDIPAGYLSIFSGTDIPMVISYMIVFSLGIMGLPHVITNFYTIKSRSILVWALPMTVIIYSLMILFQFLGFAAQYGVLELGWTAIADPDQTTLLFIGMTFPAALQGIMFSVMVAAILSTTNSFLLTGSSAVARDLYQRWFWPKVLKASPKYAFSEINISRIATLLFAFIPLLVVLNPPTLVIWLGALGWGILASCTLFPILFGFYWKKATAKGAFWSSAIGLFVATSTGLASVGYGVDTWVHPGLWGMMASFLAMVFVSSATQDIKPEQAVSTAAGK